MSLQVNQISSRWAEKEGASDKTPNPLLSTRGHCCATHRLSEDQQAVFISTLFCSGQSEKEAQDPSHPESRL